MPRPLRVAEIHGTLIRPEVQVRFPARAVHATRRGVLLKDWVKDFPGRSWDPDAHMWRITCPGPNVHRSMEDAGFAIDAFEVPVTVSSFYRPWVELNSPSTVRVYPRFSIPSEISARLSGHAVWDESSRSFVAPLSDVSSWPEKLLPQDVVAALANRSSADIQRDLEDDYSNLADASRAASFASDDEGIEELVASLVERFGDVPEWFGRDPYAYQRIGALAVAAGRRLLADVPGLGKSLQGVLAAQLLGAQRVLVVCPPVVRSNWVREIGLTGVVEHMGDGAQIVSFVPGRKDPVLPESGYVIVSDQTVGLKDDLAAMLGEWSADVLIYDEIHRAKNWDAKRSVAMRELAMTVRHRIGLSGTPLMSSPEELMSILAITGQLGPVFGGREKFAERYLRENRWGGYVPRAKMLPELGARLNESVWVRRTKEQVLPDLPPKAPRNTIVVDVALADYRRAHKEIEDKVSDAIRSLTRQQGRVPTESEMLEWCAGQLGLVSQMRRATGMVKIPAAAAYIQEWVAANGVSTGPDGEEVWGRPMIAWGIHQVVIDALAERLTELEVPFGVINGGTSDKRKQQIVDDYQAGRLPVILANIVAAGVGITLTRGSDALFVETEWLPDLLTQAEDRQHRIGQENTVTISTMVAAETLDELIQSVLRRNIEVIDAVVGGTAHHVSVSEMDIASRSVGEVLWGIAEPILKKATDAWAKEQRKRNRGR